MTGGDPTGNDYLVSVREGQAYARGSTVRLLHQSFGVRPSGLLVPEAALRRPAPIDQMKTYLTGREVLGEVVPLFGVMVLLSQVPMAAAVHWAAYWIAALENPGADRQAVDSRFIDTYFAPHVAERIHNLLRGQRRMMLTTQGLTMLMKLALIHSPPDGEPLGDSEGRLALAFLALSDHIGADLEAKDADLVISTVAGPLGREVIANQLFNAQRSEAGLFARFQRCWRELPAERADDPRVLDLQAAYLDATGMPLDDLTIVCAALWAAVVNGTPTVDISYFNGLDLPGERLKAALHRVSCDYRTMAQMLTDEVARYGVSWSMRTFEEFPVLRRADRYTVLHPQLVIRRGAGQFPMFEIVRALDATDPKQASRVRQCVEHLHELYALEAIHGIVGDPDRIYGEDTLRCAYGASSQVVDSVIDYGDAFVVAEITCHSHTHETVAGSSERGPGRDRDTFIKKVHQLQATIDNLRADAEKLTGVTPVASPRYHPVLVVIDAVAAGPIFLSMLRQRCQELDLLQGDDVAELELCELEDLDVLEGLVEQGGPAMIDVLRAKERGGLRLMSIKDFVMVERGLNPDRPIRVSSRWERWFDATLKCFKRPQD